MSKSRLSALAAILLLGGVPQAAVASDEVSGEAQRILQEMSDYLAAAQEFRFQAEVSYDSVQSTGEKIEFGAVVEVSVRRPDRLRVNNEGDEARRRIFIDGTTMTMYDLEADVYATSQVPADLDAALDLVFEKFGLSVPVADLIYRDPYSTLIASVKSGTVVGNRAIDGVSCHHLSFVQDSIDWQIWIADGAARLPRKLVITYKNEPGSPQYSARLHGWDLRASIADDYFQFRPPSGANKIEFMPATSETGQP